jgi:hypothetical protein
MQTGRPAAWYALSPAGIPSRRLGVRVFGVRWRARRLRISIRSGLAT